MADLEAQRTANRAIVTKLIHETSPLFKEEFTDWIRICFRAINMQLLEKMTALETYNQKILDVIKVQ